jgi:AcrR family transcriptional regulator
MLHIKEHERKDMPPKQTVTREEIGEAAFTIVQQEGLRFLTARNVAQKLGLSTRPIYFYFSSMQDLRKEAMRQARELLMTYISKPYTDRVFLNMGTGLAFFARDHKTLYRLLFMESNEFKDLVDEFLTSLRREMNKDNRFINMTQEERDVLLNKMWIFTHGLASLICVELIAGDADQFLIETIEKMGTIAIDAAISENLHKSI